MLADLPGHQIKWRHCSQLRERAGTAAAVFGEAADQCNSLSGFFFFFFFNRLHRNAHGEISLRIIENKSI